MNNLHFQEHNNRHKANQFAEYITGERLRRYVADKVKQYAGENIAEFEETHNEFNAFCDELCVAIQGEKFANESRI